MGEMRDPWGGWLVFDTRLSPEVLTAQGAGTFDSTYTQAGPGPGIPEPADEASRWRPQISGAQTNNLRAVTLQGGFAGKKGAAIGYVVDNDALNSDIRGWDEPTVITGWTSSATAWNAGTLTDFAAAVNPISHKIAVLVHGNSAISRSLILDPRANGVGSNIWTNGFNWASAQGLTPPFAMAYDPDVPGRLLVWSGEGAAGTPATIGYYSDDDGTSWSQYTRGWNDTTFTGAGDPMSVAVAAGVDWLMAAGDRQWASSDRGITFEHIADLSGAQEHIRALRTKSGFLVTYIRVSDGFPCCRILPTARTPFSLATEIVVASTDLEEFVTCVDDDGIVYGYGRLDAEADRQRLYRSLDDGATWAAYTWDTYETDDVGYMRHFHLVASTGSLWGIGDAVGESQGWLHVIRYGGWSNVENGPGADGFYFSRRGRFGYGRYTGSGDAARVAAWFPADHPEDHGWSRIGGSGGTRSFTIEPGMRIVTAGSREDYLGGVAATDTNSIVGEAIARIDAAGPTVATSPMYITARISNGTREYGVKIRIGTTSFTVEDLTSGTVRETETHDCTQYTHWRWHVVDSKASVWYRIAGTTKWTLAADEVVLTDGGAGTFDSMQFGHDVGAFANCTSYWRFAAAAAGAEWRYDADPPADLDLDYTDGPRGLFFGKAVPQAAYGRFAVADATDVGEDIGFISGSGGATYFGEIVNLPVAYQHGIEQACPWLSPKPDRTWESTSFAEVKVVWDQGDEQHTWYGGALALVVLNAQPREFVLEVDDGSTGWTTLATLDKGWGSINYTRTGRTLVPRAGTAEIDRYIEEDEWRGGYVVCSTASSPVARRVAHNSPGFWTTDTDKQRVRITLEDVDGSETANGTGQIVHHSGVLVFYATSESQRRRLRVRIASAAVVPGDVYRAGVMAIARVVAFPSTSWDWRRITELSRTSRRGADQVLSVRETGPPRVVLAQGWADGVAAGKMRDIDTDPDYFGVVSTIALGTDEDAWSSPLRLIGGWLESGQIPMVAVAKLPAATGTITDPSLFLYGVLQSDSVSVSNVVGTEGVDEFLRVDAPVLEGIPWRGPARRRTE